MYAILASSDTGPLAPWMKGVGWLCSSVVAIGLAWRGRANWEPAEEDVSKGPAKVSAAICAIFLAIIWVQLGTDGHHRTLIRIALWLAGVVLLALLVYIYLNATKIYVRVTSPAAETAVEKKIIGGFRLTKEAKQEIAQRRAAGQRLTTQELLKGGSYDPDLVWTRNSRAVAKLLFVIAYILLTASGTIALACAALLLLTK